jgi:cytochrome c-type biogenesis protein CcmF
MNIAGVHSTLENDIYVRLSFYNGNRVSFIAYRNPLIAFVWWGGLLFVIGTAIAVWPHPESAPVTRNRRVSMMARPAAAGD